MTAETLIAEAREIHWTTLGPYCARCRQLYPCAALRLADALEQSIAEADYLRSFTDAEPFSS